MVLAGHVTGMPQPGAFQRTRSKDLSSFPGLSIIAGKNSQEIRFCFTLWKKPEQI
jgi:hypothetical protein